MRLSSKTTEKSEGKFHCILAVVSFSWFIGWPQSGHSIWNTSKNLRPQTTLKQKEYINVFRRCCWCWCCGRVWEIIHGLFAPIPMRSIPAPVRRRRSPITKKPLEPTFFSTHLFLHRNPARLGRKRDESHFDCFSCECDHNDWPFLSDAL